MKSNGIADYRTPEADGKLYVMRVRLVRCVCLALLGTACGGPSGQRQYALHGQVLSMAANHRQATVKHDEIKGFMTAMSMP